MFSFTKYFTLNYDPFLYLLLLKFKKDESGEGESLVFQNTPLFQQNDLNNVQNNIYKEIQGLREKGKFQIIFNNSRPPTNLNKTKKTPFKTLVKEYSENEKKGWTTSYIKEVCDQIWKEKNNQNNQLDVNDGFQGELFKHNRHQNLYFLHGAFHVITTKGYVQKIVAKNKSFVKKLEEAIHNEDKDIVCVFACNSKDKKKQIENNSYLKKCFNDLSQISGSLVILGSSLDKNDQHIFDQINKSSVTHIYVSSCKKEKDTDHAKACERFSEKEITLFDYNTISYK